MQSKLSEAVVGDAFFVAGEYSERVAYPLRFEVREEDFDPAGEDPELARQE